MHAENKENARYNLPTGAFIKSSSKDFFAINKYAQLNIKAIEKLENCLEKNCSNNSLSNKSIFEIIRARDECKMKHCLLEFQEQKKLAFEVVKRLLFILYGLPIIGAILLSIGGYTASKMHQAVKRGDFLPPIERAIFQDNFAYIEKIIESGELLKNKQKIGKVRDYIEFKRSAIGDERANRLLQKLHRISDTGKAELLFFKAAKDEPESFLYNLSKDEHEEIFKYLRPGPVQYK